MTCRLEPQHLCGLFPSLLSQVKWIKIDVFWQMLDSGCSAMSYTLWSEVFAKGKKLFQEEKMTHWNLEQWWLWCGWPIYSQKKQIIKVYFNLQFGIRNLCVFLSSMRWVYLILFFIVLSAFFFFFQIRMKSWRVLYTGVCNVSFTQTQEIALVSVWWVILCTRWPLYQVHLSDYVFTDQPITRQQFNLFRHVGSGEDNLLMFKQSTWRRRSWGGKRIMQCTVSYTLWSEVLEKARRCSRNRRWRTET